MQMTELKSLSNEDLLKRYQVADAEAYRVFFERNQSLVFNFLLSRLKNRNDAEEAFQKTFLRIHRYILSYDPSQSALGWLMGIARNVSVDSFRESYNSERTVSIDDVELSSPLDEEAALEAKSSLQDIMLGLTPEECELLTRRFFSDESYEQIALNTGISEVGVRKRLSRLLRRLKTELVPA